MNILNNISSNSQINLKEEKKIKLINKRYHKIKKIASGGLSDVFLGTDIYNEYFNKNEKIAIKIPSKNIKKMEDVDAFTFAEYSFLKKLHSDNIVNVLDYGINKKSNIPYLVLEYIDGELFSQIDWSKIELNTKNKIFKTLIKTLKYIHSKNIIHADLSSMNIMLTKNNEPIIIDFGISQYFNQNNSTSLSYQKLKAFNPLYCEPQLLDGTHTKPNYQSDIFSLAVVMYEMYSNKKLFNNSSQELENRSIKLKKIPYLYRFWFKNALSYDNLLRKL